MKNQRIPTFDSNVYGGTIAHGDNSLTHTFIGPAHERARILANGRGIWTATRGLEDAGFGMNFRRISSPSSQTEYQRSKALGLELPKGDLTVLQGKMPFSAVSGSGSNVAASMSHTINGVPAPDSKPLLLQLGQEQLTQPRYASAAKMFRFAEPHEHQHLRDFYQAQLLAAKTKNFNSGTVAVLGSGENAIPLNLMDGVHRRMLEANANAHLRHHAAQYAGGDLARTQGYLDTATASQKSYFGAPSLSAINKELVDKSSAELFAYVKQLDRVKVLNSDVALPELDSLRAAIRRLAEDRAYRESLPSELSSGARSFSEALTSGLR